MTARDASFDTSIFKTALTELYVKVGGDGTVPYRSHMETMCKRVLYNLYDGSNVGRIQAKAGTGSDEEAFTPS